jgi:hypothetical protein
MEGEMGMRRFIGGCAVAVAVMAASAGAQAATFSFTLVGDIANGYFEPGTATGYIYGLSENGLGQSPTGALIVSAPSNVGVSSVYLPFYAGSGTFDVVNGSITALHNSFSNGGHGLFFGDETTSCKAGACDPDIEFRQPFTGGDYVRGNDAAVGNTLDSAGVTFKLATVPEPSSWLFMIGGIGGVGLALRRARRRVAKLSVV